jgi:acyl dehydratase
MANTKTVVMTQAMIDRYGRINGDNDIIHYDHDYAVARGFRGTLAHGLHMTGYAAEVAAQTHGADWFYHGEISTKWIAPTCPGDTVEIALGPDGTIRAEGPDGPIIAGYAKLRGAR